MDTNNNLLPCRLCGESRILQQSHIVPAFVFKWLKATGSRFLRTTLNPNQRVQDGEKRLWLCKDCEQRFSSREKLFSSLVFNPGSEGKPIAFEYDSKLHYFAVSILWRVLMRELDDGRVPADLVDAAARRLATWRQYLIDEVLSTDSAGRIGRICVFPLGSLGEGSPSPTPFFNRYMARAVDISWMATDDEMLVYAKMGHVFVTGDVIGKLCADFANAEILPEGGKFDTTQVEFLHTTFLHFLAKRSQAMGDNPPNAAQLDKIDAEAKRLYPKLWTMDSGKAIASDLTALVDPAAFGVPRVGRNEKCPCGSGVKYKRCHGRGL